MGKNGECRTHVVLLLQVLTIFLGCGVYFFFATMMILSIFFVFFLIPETKGIPLESMDRLFAVRPARKAHTTVHNEDVTREAEFRHDADGAGLEVAKEKVFMEERKRSIGSV